MKQIDLDFWDGNCSCHLGQGIGQWAGSVDAPKSFRLLLALSLASS